LPRISCGAKECRHKKGRVCGKKHIRLNVINVEGKLRMVCEGYEYSEEYGRLLQTLGSNPRLTREKSTKDKKEGKT